MASPLLLLDENLSPETVRRLQKEGHQAVWLTEFVLLGSSDAEIARAAFDANAVIVTQDLDFAETFFFGNEDLVGTIVLRLRVQTVEHVTSRLLEFLKSIEAQEIDLRTALFIVDETKYRVRKQLSEMTKPLKSPQGTTVVVAMSGGVDSSVAAALLVEQGYNCIGVMMRLWAETGRGEGSTNKCCSLESVNDARRVADQLGIPFYLINVEEPFKQNVVDFFIEGYSQGLTPNPCLACNRHIRFDYLLNYARRLGADFLATGHYARVRRQPDGTVHLLKGIDEHKDQSYVLSVMGQDELRDVLFPIGDYPKPEVRRIAAERGLPIASKHDSMDLCFIADDDYRRFLQDWTQNIMRPGDIVDRRGNVLGRHNGLPNHTIGQRKGLGIGGAGDPLYVIELDSDNNQLVVGTLDELGKTELLATGVNWTLDRPVADGTRAQCKIRYRSRPAECTLHPEGPDRVRVRFDEPLRDITPGQGAVFFDGDLCLGGGVIVKEKVLVPQLAIERLSD